MNLETNWVLNLGGRFAPGTNTYTLFTYGTLGGGADLTPLVIGGWTNTLTVTDQSGFITLSNVQFVPEPSMLLLLACGGGVLAWWRRRARR